MLRFLFLASALAAAVPALALAQPAGPPHEGLHRGPPPAGEAGGRLFISPSGEPFRGGDGLNVWFTAADTDHDGALTLSEFRADAARFFKVLDADKDRSVAGVENGIYETRIAPEITRMDLSGGRGRGKRAFITKAGKPAEPRVGAAQYSLLNEPQPVRGADVDLNQRVSAEEWTKTATRRFAILNPTGDGKLTLEILQKRW
jgi:hypothetical protein